MPELTPPPLPAASREAPGPLAFASSARRHLLAYACFAGGVGFVLLAVVGFFVSLRTSPGLLQFHTSTTLMMLVALGLFTGGYARMRTPDVVTVGPDALVVTRGNDDRRFMWDQFSMARAAQSALPPRRLLKLYGTDGRVLLKLTDHLEPFDLMVSMIQAHLAARPSPARAAVARRTSRRQGVFMVVAGVAFLALAAANVWMALSNRERNELLATRAVDGEATVVRKFTAPDGRTRRIEYRVAGAPNAPLENVEVNPLFWAGMQEGDRLPVVTVPGRPDVSRLLVGQVEDPMSSPNPNMMLAISAAVAVLALSFVVVGVLGCRGVELKWDAAAFRVRAKRPDEV